ncbi:hypothetical protein AHAS_Ahas11G0091600 [Arachis hypogaea]
MALDQHNEAVSIPKSSYKDSLLKSVGLEIDEISDYDEDSDEATPNSEDKWYKEAKLMWSKKNPLTLVQLLTKIVAWIRIPNLPIELYNHRFLWRVGSAIGTMLKIDKTTSIHSRSRFARICVEIDLAKKLLPRTSIMGSISNFEQPSSGRTRSPVES